MHLPLQPLLLYLSIAPSCFSLTFTSETIEADFDDIKVQRNAFEKNEVRTYGHLQWDGFSVDSPRPRSADSPHEGPVGVEARSAPNFIGGRVDDFGGQPTMSTKYLNSHVAFFDLERFFWGCSTVDEKTGKQGPGWCSLEITGYSHGSREPTARAQSFFWPKADAKSVRMVEAQMPSSFKSVARVEFRLVAPKPTLFVDNVRYTVFNVTSMGRGLAEVIHSQETSTGKFRHMAVPHEVRLGAEQLGPAVVPDK